MTQAAEAIDEDLRRADVPADTAGLDADNNCCMRAAQKLRKHCPGHSRTEVIRLDAGKHKVCATVFLDGAGQRRRRSEFIGALELRIEQMNGAIGAHCEPGSQDSSRLFASHGYDDNFTAMLFFQEQRLFKGVAVRFAGNECQFLIFDPRFRFIDDEPRCWIRHRLDAADNFHI